MNIIRYHLLELNDCDNLKSINGVLDASVINNFDRANRGKSNLTEFIL